MFKKEEKVVKSSLTKSLEIQQSIYEKHLELEVLIDYIESENKDIDERIKELKRQKEDNLKLIKDNSEISTTISLMFAKQSGE